MSIEEMKAKVEAALAALIEDDDSPDGVAHKLRVAGVRGKRARWYTCPLAAYLSQRTGGRVGVGSTRVWPDGWRSDGDAVPLPPSVFEFRAAFDNEDAYADLTVAA
jgi:hypothetical protein